MLTPDQLLALLANHESDAVEFTTSTKNTDKFCEAICAFANDFQRTFDVRPCYGCTLDDLVLDVFSVTYLPAAVDREVLAENQRSIREQMASLRLYDLAGDCPTNAAVLLFAKDPRRWIAGSYVQFVRWAGTTLVADPVSDKAFSGDLVTVLRELETFIKHSIESYPVEDSALRERSETDYRNPVVAEAMATLGYVNHFGRGVIRAQEALRRNGNPEASFTFEPSHVLATIVSKP